jgi:prevent-host-death family protein
MAEALKFRNIRGELVDIPRIAATRFKNEFGAIFEQASLGGAVAITKHDAPKAVLISYDEFRALMRARSPGLDDLGTQFDALLDSMQAPKVKKAMAAAFEATPAKLGRAAVKVARKRRTRRAA